MDKINILIVEDEGITAESLSNVITKLGYHVSGIAADALDAIDILSNESTDMAILDINIQGDKDGIWLADLIQKKYKIPFIFLTAYEDEGILDRAINTKPLGYLLKPFTKTDISAAIKLAMQNYAQDKRVDSLVTEEDEQNSEPFKVSNTIFIRDKHIFKKLVISEITMLKSDGHYVEVFTKNNKYLVRTKLNEFCNVLPESMFVRVHRSYVVNINSIEKFGTTFVYVNNIEIPLSTSHRDDLNTRLNTFQ